MKTLFDETIMGGIHMRNRLVRSATGENLADPGGHIPEDLLDIYQGLAKGGTGLIITSFTSVAPVDHFNDGLLRLHDDGLISEYGHAERDGIVRKAVKALQRVIANGYSFSEPDSITRARDEYQASNSTVISFYEECMCPWEDGKIVKYCTTGRIYKVYQAWCRENNNGYAKTAKEFREELAEHLGSTYAEITTRQKGNTYYKNLTITDETKQLYEYVYGTEPLMFLAG